jgi:hypothetical protein
VDIISRAEWGARAPRSRSTVSWSQRREFIVHYSEGPTSQTVRQIQNFHMDGRGWSDVGYNFLVDVSGRIYEGRGWLVVGAHAPDHNTSGIGVCMIGRDGDATPAAKRAIRWLYDEAARRAGRSLKKLGHRDVYATSCPGNELYAWVRAGMPADTEEEDDMQLTDKVKVKDWIKKRWPKDEGLADGEISVNTALASGYAFSRAAAEGVDRLVPMVEAQGAAIREMAAALAARDEAVDVDAIVARIEAAIERVTVRLDVQTGDPA